VHRPELSLRVGCLGRFRRLNGVRVAGFHGKVPVDKANPACIAGQQQLNCGRRLPPAAARSPCTWRGQPPGMGGGL
jgi:hypothetical protein